MEDERSEVAEALMRIAHGTVTGPTGLELVAMAIARGDERTLSSEVGLGSERIAEAIEEHACAIRGLASAIEGLTVPRKEAP